MAGFKKLSIGLIFLLGICSPNEKKTNKIFQDTFEDIIEQTTFDQRLHKIPTPEEYQKGKKFEFLDKRPDSLPKLRVLVNPNAVSFDFNNLDLIPDSHSFVFEIENFKEKLYINLREMPAESEKYIISVSENFDQTINDYSNHPEIDRYVSFSKILMNKTSDKALLYVSNDHSRYAGMTFYVVLDKNGKKWTISDVIGVAGS
ncbi:hypothetical protein DHD80_17960 [Gramella sp. AN32]|nr:hypothetical protein [Gramella sp. AN32]